MKNLAAISQGRDNNLNLLRFLAASAVVFTHSLAFFGKTASFDPVFRLFGIGAGDLAVNVFFVVSGYLIARSWSKRRNLVDFAWARGARIYPALWASTLAFVLLAAVALSPLAPLDFLKLPSTWGYIVKNSTMLFGAQPGLPATFEAATSSFNTPLWTLPHELQMYALVAVLGMLGLLERRAVPLVIVATSLVLWIAGENQVAVFTYSRFRLMLHFYLGVTFFLFAERIVLDNRLMLAVLAALVVTAFFVPMEHRRYVLAFVTPALVFWFGFVPAGFIRRFNSLGDYSYGIYILAFPIQLMLFTFAPAIDNPFGHLMICYTLTLLLAAMSWHLLESRALRARQPAWMQGLRTVSERFSLARKGGST